MSILLVSFINTGVGLRLGLRLGLKGRGAGRKEWEYLSNTGNVEQTRKRVTESKDRGKFAKMTNCCFRIKQE